MVLYRNPEKRIIPHLSTNGHGTSKGLAKLYGILGNNGHHNGRQLLSATTIEKLTTHLYEGLNLDYGRPTKTGRGLFFYKNPKVYLSNNLTLF